MSRTFFEKFQISQDSDHVLAYLNTLSPKRTEMIGDVSALDKEKADF